MRVYIEKGCWGCTLCSVTCPSVFKMDESEEHAVVHNQPEAENEVLVSQAIDECPAHVISTW